MKNKITLSILVAIASLHFGCDQGGDLVAPEHTESAQEVSLEKASANGRDCGCRDIEATLTSIADFTTFTAQGTIVGDLEGSISFTGDPNSVSTVSSELFPPLNPATLSFTSQLEIMSEEGTLTTRGVGVFEAGPFGVGTEFHRIVAGTGAFSGAEGTLYFNVAGDETGAQFTEAVSGEICTPCDGDEMVEVCHVPPGNPSNAHTITVGASALPAHLAHGDTEGPCDESA